MSTPGGPNFQPESLAELTRFVQYMFHGFERQLSEFSSKLDKLDVVSREQHRDDMDEVKAELKELEQNFSEYKAKQVNQTRWIIGSVIVPLVAVVVTAFLMLNGYG